MKAPRIEKLADTTWDKQSIGQSMDELTYQWAEEHLETNSEHYELEAGLDVGDDSPLFRQVTTLIAEIAIGALQNIIENNREAE